MTDHSLTGLAYARVAKNLRQRYAQGASIAELAEASGYSRSWVRGRLREVGVLRSEPAARRTRATSQARSGGASGAVDKGRNVTGAARAELGAELGMRYAQGASIRTLMAETGRSFGFVHRLLLETGVQLRGRGGNNRGRGRRPS